MTDEPIAVVGMACRFPDADRPDEFWTMLCNGHDAVKPLPPQRRLELDLSKSVTERGGFLEDVKSFDAGFFGISRLAATSLDPQHRLLLEVAWEALEFAGINPTSLRGSNAGVYIGLTARDYALVNEDVGNHDGYVALGNSANLAANRISHFMDLCGPSMAVDAACASSLVCIHLACQALRSGDIPLALAGGVSLILHPAVTVSFTRAGMLSPDGHCKTFDSGANGYVRGEGCGLIVLKRLSDAKHDGDVILAEIIGSAVNHNGRITGITNPDQRAQVAVIRQALAAARVEPSEIEFIEAHGTGTPAGDPIELAALNEVFATDVVAHEIPIGAVKTNIGHLEAAAGVASLIKTIYCLRSGTVPPNLHFKKLNPFASSISPRLRIPVNPLNLSGPKVRRTAGINSFGFGGTNSHLVLQVDTSQKTQTSTNDDRSEDAALLTLSAKSPKALSELALRFADYLNHSPAGSLLDVCHTANTGRAQFKYRLAVRGDDARVMSDALFEFAAGGQVPGVLSRHAAAPRISFLLDQTSDSSIFAADTLHDSAFDEVVHRVGAIPEAPVQQFALFCATAANWRSWGVKPVNIICTASNTVAAAVIAGFISLEEGVRLLQSNTDASKMTRLANVERNGVAKCQIILRDDNDRVLSSRSEWESYLSNASSQQFVEKRLDQVQTPHVTIALGAGESDLTAAHAPILAGALKRPTALETLAQLFVRGVDLDWSRVERLRGQRIVGLPSYPFQRRPFWIVSSGSRNGNDGRHAAPPQVEATSERWGQTVLAESSNPQPGVWEFPLSSRRIPYCDDHKAAGVVVVPGVVLLEFVLECIKSWQGSAKFSYRDVSYHRVLLLPKTEDCLVRIECREAANGAHSFGIWSRQPDAGSNWSQNVSGVLVRQA